MPAPVLVLGNTKGETVHIPEETAKRLLGVLRDNEEVLRSANAPADVEDVEDVEDDATTGPRDSGEGEVAEEPLRLEKLACPLEALEAIRDYAMRPDEERTSTIPIPMEYSLERYVRQDELDLVRRAAEGKYLTPLLETALRLKFGQLADLCSAYAFQEIENISACAPNVMEGAHLIREFLGIENEWTEEEMGHLRKEMEYAEKLTASQR